MTEVPGATGAGAAAPGPVPVAAQQQQQQGGFRPVTYIGCHITLISKSQIRYEGILYTIDTNESTVALRNVRSFGTEGRHRPEGAVPPRAEVFEFVIFRGADILTLDVTPPPQQPQQQVYHDPAIVARSFPPQPQQQVQQQRPIPQNINNSSNNNIQKQHPAQMVGPPMPQVPMPPTATPNIAAPGAPQQPQATNIVRPPQPAQNNVFATAGNRSSVAAPGSATTRTAPQNVVSTPQTAPPSRPQQQPSGDQQTRSTGAPQPGGPRPQPQAANGAVQPGGLRPMPQGYTTGSQRQPAGRPANGVQPGGLRPLPQSHTAANSNNINNRNNNINHSSAGRVQPGGLRPLPPGVQAGPKWGPPVHARNWGPPQGSQGGNHSHNMRAPAPGATVRRANGGNYAGRGRGGSRRQRRRGPGITVPSEDFDFESMHTKFDKVTIDDQQDNIPAIPAGMPAVAQPYDPSKGFFDCLVPEKQIPRERINAAQRRATDLETFGEVGNIHRHNRFRHHNGNSYRGGHNSRRGGRGRRHYNNNMGQLHNNDNNNSENNRNNNGNINQHAQHNTQQQQHN